MGGPSLTRRSLEVFSCLLEPSGKLSLYSDVSYGEALSEKVAKMDAVTTILFYGVVQMPITARVEIRTGDRSISLLYDCPGLTFLVGHFLDIVGRR